MILFVKGWPGVISLFTMFLNAVGMPEPYPGKCLNRGLEDPAVLPRHRVNKTYKFREEIVLRSTSIRSPAQIYQ